MKFSNVILRVFTRMGFELRKIESRPNKYISLPNWDYQKKVVLPKLPEKGVIMDIGSGHNPAPVANILADFFPEDTHHRANKLIEDRPVLICSVERIPVLGKKLDFIICSHIFEHLDSPLRGGEELARVGKAGYIETPAYGKDILIGTGNMHEWQVVEFEGVMHYFEYSKRQKEAHVTSPVMNIWCDRQYHPWQDFFWERQDLFNAMHLWTGAPKIIEHRRKTGNLKEMKQWSPIPENLLSDAPCSLTEQEITLLNSILSTPDGSSPMHFADSSFVDASGKFRYPVRGKRVYFEMYRGDN